jgi:oligo-1,6-glucosidase
MEWWKERVLYQIYPRSFNDSNQDGYGDINGIIEKLDYFKDLGIGILWLSPVYSSPDFDNGYDVSNYYDINPKLGTMEDMNNLLKEAEERDIKVVMDLIINHTSSEHQWFQKSKAGIEPYSDYYIWRKGKNGKKPNNWTSFFTGPAWTYDESRQKYYLHLFAPEQPDLNYQNPKVLEEVKNVMTYWLKKGVSGFRCDVINILFKNTLENGRKQIALKGIEHYLTTEGNHKILRDIKKTVLNNFDCFTVGETILVTPKTARDLTNNELDMVFSFEHMECDQYLLKWFKRKFNKKKFFKALVKWQNELDWNANYFENHDQLRSVSRFGNDKKYHKESAKALGMMLLTLRGTPFVYQGEEIGMTNFDYKSVDDLRDIESITVDKFLKRLFIPKRIRWNLFLKKTSRDNVRTPMQWSDYKNAGFTEGTPWLKVNGNYKTINVLTEQNEKDSILNFYKSMIALRNSSEVLKKGAFKEYLIQRDVFGFYRYYKDTNYLILINLSKYNRVVSVKGQVVISTYETEEYDGILKPYEGIIMEDKL